MTRAVSELRDKIVGEVLARLIDLIDLGQPLDVKGALKEAYDLGYAAGLTTGHMTPPLVKMETEVGRDPGFTVQLGPFAGGCRMGVAYLVNDPEALNNVARALARSIHMQIVAAIRKQVDEVL